MELKGAPHNLILGSLYRPHNCPPGEFVEVYDKLLKELTKEKYEVILGMDHNLDLLKVDHHKKTEEFLECNLENGIVPQITKPTQITQTSATLIDNIMISRKLCGKTLSRILIDNISDHMTSLLVLQNFKQKKREGLKIFSRDIRKNNIEKLKSNLGDIDWYNELTPHKNNIDVMTEKFQRKLGEAIDHFTPYKERTINYKNIRRERWLTGGLMNSIKKAKKLYCNSIKSTANSNEIRKYKDYILVLRKVKRYAKKKYYLDRCVEFRSNTRELWKTINQVVEKTNDKTSCIDELKTEELVLTRSKEIANELGKFFSTVGEIYAEKTATPKNKLNHHHRLILRNENSIFMSAVNEHEIAKLIEKLPNKRSSGYDNLDNILLKSIKNEIVLPLCIIFNESLSQGVFPTSMKLAEIVPLYKGKDRREKSNYRPILLLLTLSKLLEKVVYKRIYDFLNSTNQFFHSQYSFRTGHSCNQAICELKGEIAKSMEKNGLLYACSLTCQRHLICWNTHRSMQN